MGTYNTHRGAYPNLTANWNTVKDQPEHVWVFFQEDHKQAFRLAIHVEFSLVQSAV